MFLAVYSRYTKMDTLLDAFDYIDYRSVFKISLSVKVIDQIGSY